MKLYCIKRKPKGGWDTYQAAVVAAPDEETARIMSPDNGELLRTGRVAP